MEQYYMGLYPLLLFGYTKKNESFRRFFSFINHNNIFWKYFIIEVFGAVTKQIKIDELRIIES